jgi:hypothetical protein
MTMQAFAVVVRRVEADGLGRRRFAKTLHVFMTHAPPFGAYASVKHVVGVTRVTCFVG